MLSIDAVKNDYLFGEKFEEQLSKITSAKQKSKSIFTGLQRKPKMMNQNASPAKRTVWSGPLPEIFPSILMSGRRHKKLNLLIEFWNSIFIKFYFEAHQNKLASNLHSKYIACCIIFYFKLLFTLQM